MSEPNPGMGSRPFSPLKIAAVVFVGARICLIPPTPALVGAVFAGAAAAHLPSGFRNQLRATFGRARRLVRQRAISASRRLHRLLRAAGATVRLWVSNGTLVVAIWVAFTGEIVQQLIETVKLSVEIWQQEAMTVAEAGGPWPASVAAA